MVRQPAEKIVLVAPAHPLAPRGATLEAATPPQAGDAPVEERSLDLLEAIRMPVTAYARRMAMGTYFEVFLAGVDNTMRSMITGRYMIRPQVGP